MFTRSRVLTIVIPIILALIASMIDQSRYTTYEEFLREHLDEDDEIISITLTSYSLLQKKTFTTKIEDPRVINKIIKEPAMELKRSFTSSELSRTTYPNELHIQGEKSSFTFQFSESAIYKEKNYKINAAPDSLFHIIQGENLEWEMEDER